MPTRPTLLVSPILAMPTVSVANTNGAMIILIRRRKMSVTSRNHSTQGLLSVPE